MFQGRAGRNRDPGDVIEPARCPASRPAHAQNVRTLKIGVPGSVYAYGRTVTLAGGSNRIYEAIAGTRPAGPPEPPSSPGSTGDASTLRLVLPCLAASGVDTALCGQDQLQWQEYCSNLITIFSEIDADLITMQSGA